MEILARYTNFIYFRSRDLSQFEHVLAFTNKTVNKKQTPRPYKFWNIFFFVIGKIMFHLSWIEPFKNLYKSEDIWEHKTGYKKTIVVKVVWDPLDWWKQAWRVYSICRDFWLDYLLYVYQGYSISKIHRVWWLLLSLQV